MAYTREYVEANREKINEKRRVQVEIKSPKMGHIGGQVAP